MGIFRSLYRYIVTLGGLIEGDISGRTDDLVSTPSGIKATFQKTREEWTKQYAEVREAVAQLMMVLNQKHKRIEELSREAEQVKTKLKGAVAQFKATNDAAYQKAFTDLFNRDKAIAAEQEKLSDEVVELRNKVEVYKAKLKEMQARISDLQKQESEAIADIVSSTQIVKLNDRLNSVSTELDDQNLRAIRQRREMLMSQAKLSGELAGPELERNVEEELLAAGMKSEAADVFAAMLAEETKQDPETAEAEAQDTRQRDM